MARILITGAAGFAGAHFVEHFLRSTEHELVLLCRCGFAGSLRRIISIEGIGVHSLSLTNVWHDLRSPINGLVAKEIGQVDYIIHLAAESHVDRSIEDPRLFVESNVMSTLNILEFARTQKGLKKFFNFSTDEVFGPAPAGVFHKENFPYRPSNPYAASKAGAAALGYSYFRTYGVPVVTTYTMNLIGERQHPEKFVPKTIRALLAGENVILHGSVENPSCRCWLHARNAADAILFLMGRGQPGEFYNVVGEEKSVAEMAEIIAVTVGRRAPTMSKVEYVDVHSCRPGHDFRYALSGEAMANLGWRPPVNLEPSLIKTVNWTLDHKEWLRW